MSQTEGAMAVLSRIGQGPPRIGRSLGLHVVALLALSYILHVHRPAISPEQAGSVELVVESAEQAGAPPGGAVIAGETAADQEPPPVAAPSPEREPAPQQQPPPDQRVMPTIPAVALHPPAVKTRSAGAAPPPAHALPAHALIEAPAISASVADAPARAASSVEVVRTQQALEAADSVWLAGVATWLVTHRTYPEMARALGRQGMVVMQITVDRNGHVEEVDLVRGSGSELLDRAAEALLRGAQLPPFPPEMTLPRKSITVPIRYRLE